MKIKENIEVTIMSLIMPFVFGFIIFRIPFPDWYAVICYAFIIVALYSFIYPKGGEFIHKTASKAGAFIGKYIAIAVLAIVYIIAVIPTGLLMKAVKRDRLKLKKTDISTYWVDYENNNTDYEYQF